MCSLPLMLRSIPRPERSYDGPHPSPRLRLSAADPAGLLSRQLPTPPGSGRPAPSVTPHQPAGDRVPAPERSRRGESWYARWATSLPDRQAPNLNCQRNCLFESLLHYQKTKIMN